MIPRKIFMYTCRQCGKQHSNPESGLCNSCKNMYTQMDWGNLMKTFILNQTKIKDTSPKPEPKSEPEPEEEENLNKTTCTTVDDILTKSGHRGHSSLSTVELKMLKDHRLKMTANQQ